jgi:hypothetical protein
MLTDLSWFKNISIKTAGCFHPPGAFGCFKPLSFHQVLYTLSPTMKFESIEVYRGNFMISFVLTVPWRVLWAWRVPFLPFLYNIMFCHSCLRYHQMYGTLQSGNFKCKRVLLRMRIYSGDMFIYVFMHLYLVSRSLSLTHTPTDTQTPSLPEKVDVMIILFDTQ